MSENTPLVSPYARSIGVTEADAHTARNIHLSVADCKHLRNVLQFMLDEGPTLDPIGEAGNHSDRWNQELSEYLKGAV